MLEGNYSDRHMNEQAFMDKFMKQVQDVLDNAEKAKLKEKGGSSWIKGVLEKAKKEANKDAMVKKALGFFKTAGIDNPKVKKALSSMFGFDSKSEPIGKPKSRGLASAKKGER